MRFWISPPVHSVYWWEGAVCREDEIFFTAKTTRELFPRLVEAVTQLHSYDVPQIVFIPIAEGYGGYMDWLRDMVKKR